MAQTSLADRNRSKASFLSLPREIRDLVYHDLVISSEPIHFNQLCGPLVSDVAVDDGLLRLWGYLAQVVQEACEMFYSQNTFVIFDDGLPSFLDSNICSWLLHCPQDHSLIMEGSNFRVNCYLTKLEIFQDHGDFINYQEHGAGLRYLVTCP